MSAPARLLLDTHVFIWWRSDIGRMREAARQGIATAESVFVSAASAWESAIKISLGRLELPDRFETGVVDSGFEELLITFTHAEAVAALPYHHRDPFDRLLVAQAVSENLTLVTHDKQIGAYEVPILWA